jgi:hypothetical protein
MHGEEICKIYIQLIIKLGIGKSVMTMVRVRICVHGDKDFTGWERHGGRGRRRGGWNGVGSIACGTRLSLSNVPCGVPRARCPPAIHCGSGMASRCRQVIGSCRTKNVLGAPLGVDLCLTPPKIFGGPFERRSCGCSKGLLDS